MPRLRFPFILRAVSALIALGSATFAATAPDPRTDNMRERVLRMTEFFDTTLPGTVGKRNMTLHFTPKFSDFRDREYVRYPFEVRYGIG